MIKGVGNRLHSTTEFVVTLLFEKVDPVENAAVPPQEMQVAIQTAQPQPHSCNLHADNPDWMMACSCPPHRCLQMAF